MYGRNDRSTKAKLKHFAGGDQPRAVFKIGEYEVEIPTTVSGKDERGNERYAEPAVTYRSKHRHTTDSRATLPGLEVCDGQIRIELTDLVGLVLSRLEPVDLARALWSNDDVKAEFMRCLSERYASDDFDDSDRRKFLSAVKETVHQATVDKFASIMSTKEFDVCRYLHAVHEINRINQVLTRLDVRVPSETSPEGVLLQFDRLDNSVKQPDGNCKRGELEVSGRAWNESREFWRKEVLKQFPLPPKDAPAQPDQGPEIAARATEGG